MTNLEAYNAIFSKYGVAISNDQATSDLGLAGIDPNGTYDATQQCLLYTPALSRMSNKNAGIASVSEAGYSISYDKQDEGKFLYNIAKDSGCAQLIARYNPLAKVKDASERW